jgi:hypothetical protein
VTTSGPEVPLTAEQRARLNDLLDPANLLHRECGRRIAEHPYPHLVQVVCPFPPLPPVEIRAVDPVDPP